MMNKQEEFGLRKEIEDLKIALAKSQMLESLEKLDRILAVGLYVAIFALGLVVGINICFLGI